MCKWWPPTLHKWSKWEKKSYDYEVPKQEWQSWLDIKATSEDLKEFLKPKTYVAYYEERHCLNCGHIEQHELNH